MSRNSSGPSLKKKFVGLIRQISQPGGSQALGSDHQHTIPRPDTFIHKYLQGWVLHCVVCHVKNYLKCVTAGENIKSSWGRAVGENNDSLCAEGTGRCVPPVLSSPNTTLVRQALFCSHPCCCVLLIAWGCLLSLPPPSSHPLPPPWLCCLHRTPAATPLSLARYPGPGTCWYTLAMHLLAVNHVPGNTQGPETVESYDLLSFPLWSNHCLYSEL